jgi:uncharacterized protein YjeT (DUF2065 family)
MTIPDITAAFVAALLVVTGLSHVLHPGPWTRLFKDLLDRPYAGMLVGLPAFMTGLLVLLGHHEFSGVRTAVTLVGIAWTIKGTLYLLLPDLLRRIASRHADRTGHMRVAGAALVVLGSGIAMDLLLVGDR